MASNLLIGLGFFTTGVSWALINIDRIVIIWELATDSKLGSYTGMYYLLSSFAAVIGPGVIGFIFDIFVGGEYYLLFPLSISCYAIAFL